MSLEDIAKDDELNRFAVAGGRSAFLVNCVQCHGSGAAGSPGYPNLNDDDWLWGGTLEAIHTTITHGIRYTQDPDTRVSEMPAFGADGILDAHQIEAVANYVLSLSGHDHDAALAAGGQADLRRQLRRLPRRGRRRQPRVRRAAPERRDLALSATRPSIIAQITKPRHGVMPAWAHRLDPTTIKELALFVHSLGGGEAATAALRAGRGAGEEIAGPPSG